MQGHTSTDIAIIDVSNHNGVINWSNVKTDKLGIKGVYMKATEGRTYKDPMFAAHARGAHSIGLPIGAYHFARSANNSPEDEANNFLSTMKSVMGNYGDLIPVLDLETANPNSTGKYLAEWSRKFVNIVQSATGKKVMIYSGNWFINQYNIAGLSDIPLWTSYYKNVSNVPNTGGWQKWAMWQYTDTGRVNGINGNVDLNWCSSLSDIMSEIKVEKIVVPAPKTDTKTVVDEKPKPINITVNGQPRMAVFYKGATHIIWTVLRDLIPQKNTHLGDGLFDIAGRKVQGIVYEKNTYLPWGLIAPGKIKVERLDGKPVNFVYKA